MIHSLIVDWIRAQNASLLAPWIFYLLEKDGAAEVYAFSVLPEIISSIRFENCILDDLLYFNDFSSLSRMKDLTNALLPSIDLRLVV